MNEAISAQQLTICKLQNRVEQLEKDLQATLAPATAHTKVWLKLADLDGLLDCRFEEIDETAVGICHVYAGTIDIGSLLSDAQAEELIAKFWQLMEEQDANQY